MRLFLLTPLSHITLTSYNPPEASLIESDYMDLEQESYVILHMLVLLGVLLILFLKLILALQLIPNQISMLILVLCLMTL